MLRACLTSGVIGTKAELPYPSLRRSSFVPAEEILFRQPRPLYQYAASSRNAATIFSTFGNSHSSCGKL
jgi:hypothetical protein